MINNAKINPTIISLQNPLIKNIIYIKKKNNDKSSDYFICEGYSFLKEALHNKWDVTNILYTAKKRNHIIVEKFYKKLDLKFTKISFVDPKILKKLSQMNNPQDYIFVTRKKQFNLPKKITRNAIFIALEEIKDPGNLGNIFRTIEAFGIKLCFLIGNCVNPYSTEVIRSSMGSIFNLKFVKATKDNFLEWIKANNVNLYGTSSYSNLSHLDHNWSLPLAIVMGSENSGVSKKIIDNCKCVVKIKTTGRAESLNVSAASAILISELIRKYPM